MPNSRAKALAVKVDSVAPRAVDIHVFDQDIGASVKEDSMLLLFRVRTLRQRIAAHIAIDRQLPYREVVLALRCDQSREFLLAGHHFDDAGLAFPSEMDLALEGEARTIAGIAPRAQIGPRRKVND